MRVTSSGAYARPGPVPKMPEGLEQLMEEMTREVLKNNPSDVYAFCANHFANLIEIRDGSSPKKQVTLQQKILRAQNIVRERAKERRRQFDYEMSLMCNNPSQNDSNVTAEVDSKVAAPALPSLKAPVHHEQALQHASEVEYSQQTFEENNPANVEQTPIGAVDNTETVTINSSEKTSLEEISNSDEIAITNVSVNNADSARDMQTNHENNADAVNETQSNELLKNSDTNIEETNNLVKNTNVNTIVEVIDKDANTLIEINDAPKNELHEKVINAKNEVKTHVDNVKEAQKSELDKLNELTGSGKQINVVNPNIELSEDTQGTTDKRINELDKNNTETQLNEIVTNATAENTQSNKLDNTGSSVKENVDTIKIELDTNVSTASQDQVKRENTSDSCIEGSKVLNETDTVVKNTTQEIESDKQVEEKSSKIDNIPEKVLDHHVHHDNSSIDSNPNILHELSDAANETIYSVLSDPSKIQNSRQIISNERDTATYDSVTTNIAVADTQHDSGHGENIFINPSADEKAKNSDEANCDDKTQDNTVADTAVSENLSDVNASNDVFSIDKNNLLSSGDQVNDTATSNKTTTINLCNVPLIITTQGSNDIESMEDNILPTAAAPTQSTDDMSKPVDSENKAKEDDKNCSDLESKHSNDLNNITLQNNEADQDQKPDSHANAIDGGGSTSSDQVDDGIGDDENNPNGVDLESAAVTIQKVFRSFMFKSRNSTFEDPNNDGAQLLDEDDDKKEEYYAAAAANIIERRSLGITRMDTVLQTVNEEKSLSLSTDDSSTLSSAATTIQAHVRGFLVRSRYNSNRTISANSLVNSHEAVDTDAEQHKNKTILNIHIVPEEGNYLSRDESIITSMDLSLDGSPPSSINLHPLSYDLCERRKMLKREDAIQSISPPSNNSGKLSEDSIKDGLVNDTDGFNDNTVEDKIDFTYDPETIISSSDATAPKSPVSILHVHKSEEAPNSPIERARAAPRQGRSLTAVTALNSDESDVVTPFALTPRSTETSKLIHSGEFHDLVLPTKVSRGDTSAVRGE